MIVSENGKKRRKSAPQPLNLLMALFNLVKMVENAYGSVDESTNEYQPSFMDLIVLLNPVTEKVLERLVLEKTITIRDIRDVTNKVYDEQVEIGVLPSSFLEEDIKRLNAETYSKRLVEMGLMTRLGPDEDIPGYFGFGLEEDNIEMYKTFIESLRHRLGQMRKLLEIYNTTSY